MQALLVGEYLSFRRAARTLGVRQSAVSRRVRELEDELGVSLFERDRAGVRVTNSRSPERQTGIASGLASLAGAPHADGCSARG